jgi:hypothetical protein
MARLLCYATARHANRACCDLPFNMGSITLKALTWKSSKSPAHAHPRWPPAIFRTFNTHNKCTGVRRFVRGISVGISRRVADCGVSVGPAGAPDLPGGPGPRYPGTATSACCDQSSSNPAWQGQPYPREVIPRLTMLLCLSRGSGVNSNLSGDGWRGWLFLCSGRGCWVADKTGMGRSGWRASSYEVTPSRAGDARGRPADR